MNIFVLSPNAQDSAHYFFMVDPIRATKQILEITQMLVTAAAQRQMLGSHFVPMAPGLASSDTTLMFAGRYSITAYENNPVTRWVAASEAHWAFALSYALWLAIYFEEFSAKKEPHGCHTPLTYLRCLYMHLHGTWDPDITDDVPEDIQFWHLKTYQPPEIPPNLCDMGDTPRERVARHYRAYLDWKISNDKPITTRRRHAWGTSAHY